MTKTVDRAGAIKMAGLAGIGTLLASLSNASRADAKSPRGSNPMNLTITTKPSARGPAVCYTIIVGDKVAVPANADTLIQAHIGSVSAVVKSNHWKPVPNHGDGDDEWLTVYVTSC